MRKVKTLLLITLAVLLAGCFGINADVYDGSPATLSVTVQSKADQSVKLMSDQEVETVLVRVWRTNEDGVVIYSEFKDVVLDENGKGELSEVVPAAEGYTVTAIHQKESVLDIGETETNVPADKITNINVLLESVSQFIEVPDRVYSGGSTLQFRWSETEYGDYLVGHIHLATAPWVNNGENDKGWIVDDGVPVWNSRARSDRFFPSVTEPTKIYYQYAFTYRAPGHANIPYTFAPDLEKSEELPYIWLYPSPDWEPVVE